MTNQPSAFLSNNSPVCPPELLARAKASPAPVVAIANAGAVFPMQAAKEATELGLITPLFTGNAEDIQSIAVELDWDISSFELVTADTEAAAGEAAAKACGQGRANILMKGQIHSDIFLKSALARDAGLRNGSRLVHIFHMSHPNGGKPLLLTDGAVNVAPDEATFHAATREVVSLLRKLGNASPRVAFLSATENPIPSVPSSLVARELRDWARSNIEDAEFSGPLALDLILSTESAKQKGCNDDPVAGYADAVVVPDIVSGNVLFKSLVYLSGACAAGVISGARVPLVLTSRADPPAARLASLALAIVAVANDKTPE